MRVVFNQALDGTFEVITDAPCEVYVVSDYCPNDRVYRMTDAHLVGHEAVDAVLRDDTVGHAGDERHNAIKHRILSVEAGQPHLTPVK